MSMTYAYESLTHRHTRTAISRLVAKVNHNAPYNDVRGYEYEFFPR